MKVIIIIIIIIINNNNKKDEEKAETLSNKQIKIAVKDLKIDIAKQKAKERLGQKLIDKDNKINK